MALGHLKQDPPKNTFHKLAGYAEDFWTRSELPADMICLKPEEGNQKKTTAPCAKMATDGTC